MKNKLTNAVFPTGKKLLKYMMRLSIFLFCATVFSFTPDNVLSQNTKVVIEADEEVTVDQVFEIISQQTKYAFIYETGLFNDAPKVKLKKGVVSANALLRLSLASGDYNLVLTKENNILINRAGETQQTQVTGNVTDAAGFPVPDVTVLIKGTGKGTATDFDGNYSITVPNPENVLVFSALGFATQEITVGSQSVLNVTLKEQIGELDEVMVTGYQKIEKVNNTGSFAKADIAVLQNRGTSMNVLNRIEGLMPGIVINQSPIDEEGVDNSILIRGLTTINANRQPLFVVDGVAINNLSTVNPQDIEDVTVLKDASASAIYGSRAANGVVVITTKKGKINNEVIFDYDTFVNIQGKPDLDYIPTLTSRQFIATAREIFDPVLNPYGSVSNTISVSSRGVPPHEQILYDLYNGLINQATADAELEALASFNNKNQIKDLWYREAMLNNHTISASGGNNMYSFYSSLAYTGAINNTPGDSDDTYKININQDFKFNSKFKVGLITDITQRINSSKRSLAIDNRTLPYLKFRDEQGNNLPMTYMQRFSRDELSGFETESGIELDYNPLDEFNRGYDRGEDFQARIAASLNWELFDGFEFQGLYGYVHGNGEIIEYDKSNSFVVRLENATMTQPGESPTHYIPLEGGHFYEENDSDKSWTVRNQLNYRKDWDDKHRLNILLGQEAQEKFVRASSSFIRAFDENSFTYSNLDLDALSTSGINNPVVATSPFGTSSISLAGRRAPKRIIEDRNRFSSYYSSLNYTNNNKYIINASGRIDRSNLFGADKAAQNKLVWSSGIKWIIGNEDFLNNLTWLDNLGLRATYGLTGNAPSPGTASSYDILSPSSSSLFDIGYTITTPGNPGLTWESTRTLDLGIDFDLFDNRISGTLDYYSKKTENLIGFVPTNSFTGYSSITGNLGDIENKGVEILLKSLNINSTTFSWSTQFVLGFNKNKITKLNQQNPVVDGGELIHTRYLEGYSAFSLFAYDFVSLDEMGDPQVQLADGSITKNPFGVTADDMKYMGSYQPKWSGGLSNFFSYKNFSLNANIIFNLGHVMRSDSPSPSNPYAEFTGGRLITESVNNFMSGNLHPDILDRWRQPGDESFTDVPSYVANSSLSQSRRNTNYYTYGDINVTSASYAKLRDISLFYNLPKTFLDRLNFSSLSLRFQLNNLMLWKKNNEGIDPEFHNLQRGQRSLPFNQKSITFGLHVSL